MKIQFFCTGEEKPVDASKRRGEVWVNINRDDFCGLYHSFDNAKSSQSDNTVACVRVPWVEGEGLKENLTNE